MPDPPACRPASRSPGAVPGSLVEIGPLRPEAGLVGRPGGPPGAAAPREVITPRALSPPRRPARTAEPRNHADLHHTRDRRPT